MSDLKMGKQDFLKDAIIDALIFDNEAARLSEEWAGLVTLSPKEIRSSEKKNFMNIRSVVMDLHNLFELIINLILADHFSNEHCRSDFSEKVLPLISFEEKLTIVRRVRLVKLTKQDNKLIDAINKIRNTFAHGFSIDNKRFLYKDDNAKHIVYKRGVIKEFHDDAIRIIKYFFDERKRLLKKER